MNMPIPAFSASRRDKVISKIPKLLLILLALAVMGGCAGGRAAFNKGEKLEQEGKLDEAVLRYSEAAAANPEVAEYRVRFLKTSAEAARRHMALGDKFLNEKKYDEALREYQSAVALDPSLQVAVQQSDLVLKLRNAQLYHREGVEFEKNNKLREALRAYQKAANLNPDDKSAREAVARLLKSRNAKLDGYELNLKSSKPITLKFKDAKLKEVFTILSQLSGINFIFDEAVKDQNVSIYMENATFQQALDILTNVNKLGKKVLNESTIIIFPKTPDKLKQYEELMVETFYLNKLDAKKAVNLIRTMLQVKKIYVNEEMNALVIRDTPEVIEVARKILEANDIPDAEVLLDVEVVEIAKSKADSFGLLLSRYALSTNVITPEGQFFSDTLPQTVTTTSSTGSTTTTTQTTQANLLNIFNWRGFGGFLTVPNATFNFGKTLTNGETLANPKIRIKNREKAKFNVGTRVPITTTSSPTGGGVSVNVQYVDVGVKVNAEPTIQLNNDVSIKLSLEVSSILSRDKIGDASSLTTVVTIGTRNLDTVLNLKDGETSIIGGLIQDQKSKSNKKVFILGDLPLIGPLLSSNDNTNDKTELVLAITPHIVRGVTIPDKDVAMFWSGKEDEPSLTPIYSSFSQESDLAPADKTASSQVPGGRKTSAPSATAKGGASQPAATGTPAAPESTTAPVAQPSARVTMSMAAPSSVKVNDQFSVEVKVSDAAGLYRAPFILSYDPLFLDFVGASEGGFLKQDGKPTQFRFSVDKNTGQVSINLGRVGDAGGVSGAGTLITATFKAKNKGPANLGFLGVNLAGAGGKPIESLPFNAVVEVK